MSDPNCVFCKIVKGEIPSHKIFEDEDFIAILDIFPNTKGMSLVLTKKHFDSYAADLDNDTYVKFFLTAKKVSKLLDKKLGSKRTALVMEGMGINHAHIKLYPMHGLEDDFRSMIPEEKVFFDKYPGYITTLLGNKASDEELNQIRNLF